MARGPPAVTGIAGIGWGKVILLGEHAAVYGHPVLAGAIDRPVTAHAKRGHTRLRVPAWHVDTDKDPDATPSRAFRALLAALAVTESDVVVTTDLPSRAGLGSSAALAVAITRALHENRGDLPDFEVERMALEAERIFHGTPSGVDVALAARGGLGLFRRGEGLTPLAIPAFSVCVCLSGIPRDTAARVADVARLRQRFPAQTDRILSTLGELAQSGVALLQNNAPTEIGPLFVHAQCLLTQLGVSTPLLDELCRVALAAGATGAKLTGAGGGGAVIAVAEQPQTIVDAWRQRGYEAFTLRVGA